MNITLLLLQFAMALVPVGAVRLWLQAGLDTHHRPAATLPTQFHLSTGLILVLMSGSGLVVLSGLNFTRFDEQCETVLLLFAALALLIFEILEHSEPSRERIVRFRVIQCYPPALPAMRRTQKRAARRITLRYY